uniref:Uncharacterized protein n=1 Tax=Oreochromis niloticus TaxID=8128 RepID=A0A669E1T9_ORENI
MSSERKALLEKAYPEVRSFCCGLGLVFEVVDLRWGIRNVPSGDHEACEVFLEEIQRCEQMSAGPTFIVSALSSSSPGQRLRLDCSHKRALCLFLLTFYVCLGEFKCLYFFVDFNFF